MTVTYSLIWSQNTEPSSLLNRISLNMESFTRDIEIAALGRRVTLKDPHKKNLDVIVQFVLGEELKPKPKLWRRAVICGFAYECLEYREIAEELLYTPRGTLEDIFRYLPNIRETPIRVVSRDDLFSLVAPKRGKKRKERAAKKLTTFFRNLRKDVERGKRFLKERVVQIYGTPDLLSKTLEQAIALGYESGERNDKD